VATIRTIAPSPRYPVERYRVLCKIDGRQVQYGVYSDPAEALRAKLQCEQELAAGKDLALANQPLGYYIKYVWLPTYAASRNREKNVKFLLNEHILPGLGELTFKELHTLTPLARWKTGLVHTGYAPSTIDDPGLAGGPPRRLPGAVPGQ
jgi:hypothetical protein